MKNIFGLIIISFFSFKLQAQLLVANPEKFKVVTSAQPYSIGYPFSGVENVSLTNLGSSILFVGQTSGSQGRNFVKIDSLGRIYNLSPVSGLLGDNYTGHYIDTGGLVMSQNEKYYYYVYYEQIFTTGNLVQLSINDGVLSSNIIYMPGPNQTIYNLLATNNQGSVATVVENRDLITNQALSYDIILIDNLANVTNLERIAAADFSYYKIYINEQNKVSILSNRFPFLLYSYTSPGVRQLVAQGISFDSDVSVQLTEAEDVYFLSNNKILNNVGEILLDRGLLNFQEGRNLSINSFYVSPEKIVYTIASSGASYYFMKNNESLLSSGQSLLNINIRYLIGLRGNDRGEMTFKLGDSTPQTISHIIKYSGDSKKSFKIRKTISILRNNTLTQVGNPNFFQMIPTVDTRGTVCAQNYAPSRIRIRVECQNNEAPFENVEGCRIQMHKELGENLGGHFEVSHDMAERPLGRFLNNQIEQQFIGIPVGGLNFNYEAPEPAGEIDLNFIAFGPDNKVIEVAKSVAQVKIGNLVSLADVSYLTMRDTGHMSEDETEEGGVYSTSDFRTRLNDALELYYQKCLRAGIPESQIVLLTSEAASLLWGGLYDIDHDWNPSHCGHRVGNAIDLGMANFRLSTSPYVNQMKRILKESLISRRRFHFPIQSESPAGSKHWHTQHR